MKKGYVISFISGLIVAGSIGVVAYTMNARQIAYEPSDNTWEVNNVGDAIDSIKEGFRPKFGTTQYNQNMTTVSTTSQKTTLNLDKGKYLVIQHTDSAQNNTSVVNTVDAGEVDISCTNDNCNIERLSGKRYKKTGTTAYTTNQYYYSSSLVTSYYVEVKENNTTLESYNVKSGSENPKYSLVISLQAIPIS